MKKQIQYSLLMTMFATFLVSCLDRRPSGSKAGEHCQGAACASSTSGDDAAAEDARRRAIFGSGTPTYSDPSINDYFNRDKTYDPQIPADYKNVFIAKRIDAYRPVYFDLTQKKWSSYLLWDATKSFLEPKPEGLATVHVTLFQPFTAAMPTLFPFYPVRPYYFFVAGHTANAVLDTPHFPTLVLMPSPWGPKDADPPISWPSDYKLVYFRQSETSQALIQKCNTALAESRDLIGDWSTAFECGSIGGPAFNAGFSTVMTNSHLAEQKNPGDITKSSDSAFNLFYNMLSVAIWRPQAPAGYQCLGDITTNADTKKPSTEVDNVSDQNSNTGSTKAATYCIAEKYLVPGFLDKVIMTDGVVSFYTIGSNDPNAYLDTNLFMASVQPPANVKAWVLNKKFIKLMPDDIIQK